MDNLVKQLQQQLQNLTNQLQYRDKQLATYKAALAETVEVQIETRTLSDIRQNAVDDLTLQLDNMTQAKEKLEKELSGSKSGSTEVDRLNRVVEALKNEIILLNETNEALRDDLDSRDRDRAEPSVN